MIFKLTSEFNTTSNKIPRGFFFCGNRQTNSKIHIERHRACDSQEKKKQLLEEKGKEEYHFSVLL